MLLEQSPGGAPQWLGTSSLTKTSGQNEIVAVVFHWLVAGW